MTSTLTRATAVITTVVAAGTFAVSAVLAVHLLLVMISPQPNSARTVTRPTATRTRAAGAAVRAPDAAKPNESVEARVLAYRAEHSAFPTGAVVGEWLGGKSSKTGVRLVNRIRAQEAANA